VIAASVGGFYVIAATRSATVSGTAFGSRTKVMTFAVPVEMAFRRLVANPGQFSLEDSDAASGALVLATGPTFATWGFFYPIVIAPSGADGCQITVGIKSRLIQFGPLVTKWHNQCSEHVSLVVGSAGDLPPARVVKDG